MMASRRKLTTGIRVFLMAVGVVVSLAAQQRSWEELNREVLALLQQGKYAEGLVVAQQALRVAEASFGPEHPNVATSLNNLAGLYQDQGKYAEAEQLSRRCVVIKEKALGPDSVRVATSLNNLADLYRAEGRYPEAEQFYKRSLRIVERAIPGHPNAITSLNNLAAIYYDQGKY